jgi:hypothetical protein
LEMQIRKKLVVEEHLKGPSSELKHVVQIMCAKILLP